MSRCRWSISISFMADSFSRTWRQLSLDGRGTPVKSVINALPLLLLQFPLFLLKLQLIQTGQQFFLCSPNLSIHICTPPLKHFESQSIVKRNLSNLAADTALFQVNLRPCKGSSISSISSISPNNSLLTLAWNFTPIFSLLDQFTDNHVFLVSIIIEHLKIVIDCSLDNANIVLVI